MARTYLQVVEARLARPRLPPILLRDRLIDQLRRGVPAHPLTLVTAGAGYGKTTLMASATDNAPESTLWYSLGEEDADLTRFLRHVGAALQRHNRRYGRALKAMLDEGTIEARSAATAAGALLNDLGRIKESMVLVLDDFHLVQGSKEIQEFLSIVVENNRSPVHLMIASRTEPPLPLGRLRARRMVLELGPADLAFTAAELKSLLEEVHHRPMSEDDIDFLARFTEGWVTPIQLALQADGLNAPRDLPRTLRRAMASGATLHDYLAAEVLDRQPPGWRRWILETSPFEEIEPELLRTVLGEPDPEGRLGELLRMSLIQAFEGETGTVYRYHVLLRELLVRRFQVEVPEADRDRLHRAGAAWFRRRGDLVGAARQLAFLDDRSVLAEFLRAEGLALLDAGHYQALTHWLDQLPAHLVDEDAWLRLRRADARHFLADWPGAELDYEKARALFAAASDSRGEAWAILGLARLWNLRGQSLLAVEEGEAALRQLASTGDNSAEELEVRLNKVVSGAYYYQGRYADAIRGLDRLEELARGHPERQATLWNNRAVVHASQGNYPEAAAAFEKGLRRPGARQSPRAPLHLSNLGLLLNEMGDPERARVLFDEALRRARHWKNRSHQLSALLGQAHLLHRLGNTEGCLTLLKEVDELNDELKIPLLVSDAMALRARVLAESNQHAAARELLRGALAAWGTTTRDSHWLLYRVEDAVIDLKSGRTEEALAAFDELRPVAFELEALFPRMRLLFHRGEAAMLEGLPDAESELTAALELGQRLGYDAFLRAEFRRDPKPFLFLLKRGVASDYLARLAIGAGAALELEFLDLVGDATLPPVAGKTVLRILAETGGPPAHRRISASSWTADGPLTRAARAALDSIERRHPDLTTLRPTGRRALIISLLGPLKMTAPTGELEAARWTSQRALSLFLYLVLRGDRGVSRDRLIELFWPGRQRRGAESNFHPTLSYVRRALKDVAAGQVVVTVNGLYQVDPDLPITIDVRHFEALASEGRARGKSRDRIQALEEAARLYRGDLLEDREEPWADDLRTQLGLRYEGVLAELAGLLLSSGDAGRAIPHARTLLARSPYREEVHLLLMRCYNLAGDRQAVHEQYRRMVRLLREDLGIEPLPETTRSYESLVAAS
ncbi:MAG TPA: BTAD domain-containing putative transcriptional regulator [Candidatus Eisenbacteria bacterium]